jgi:hypothetical protein
MPKGGARPGAGRRHLAAGEARLNRVIRFRPHEWAWVEEQAARIGITPSEYVRRIVLDSYKERKGE